MGAEVVHDDDVAGPQRRRQDLLDVEAEALAIDRAIDEPWRLDAIVAQGGDEGHGLPAPVRHLGPRRWPRGAQPRSGAMLVLVQVSSMKTRREGSNRPDTSSTVRAAARRRGGPARWRSASFFMRQFLGVDELPDHTIVDF